MGMIEPIHVCEQVYALSSMPIYGQIDGVCRITGKLSTGVLFNEWVKPTFTDHAFLKPGSIVSNEALFCFDEASEELMHKTGRDKVQRFRTYSHVINGGLWKCYTKANKREIFEDIVAGAELVCLTDSGQKHVLFKHKAGMWQLDDLFVQPDIDYLLFLHGTMTELLNVGFTQAAVLSGGYNLNFVIKNGADVWKRCEDVLKQHRGKPMFDFAGWMLFKD